MVRKPDTHTATRTRVDARRYNPAVEDIFVYAGLAVLAFAVVLIVIVTYQNRHKWNQLELEPGEERPPSWVYYLFSPDFYYSDFAAWSVRRAKRLKAELALERSGKLTGVNWECSACGNVNPQAAADCLRCQRERGILGGTGT